MNEFRVFNLEALEKTFIGKHLNKEVYAHFLAIKKNENDPNTRSWLIPQKLINRPKKLQGVGLDEQKLIISNIVIKKKVVVKMGKEIDMLKRDYDNALLLSQLNCPNFMKYLGFFQCKDNINNYSKNKNLPPYFCQKDGSTNGFIFMDYFELGSLDKYNPKNMDEIISIINQIFASLLLAYLTFGFIHNDLHTGNILVKKTSKPYFTYKIKNKTIKIQTHGIQIVFFDFDRSLFVENKDNNFSKFFNEIYFFIERYNVTLMSLNIFYNTLHGKNAITFPLSSLKKVLEDSYTINKFIKLITPLS